jgi:sulfate adenylyltransferase
MPDPGGGAPMIPPPHGGRLIDRVLAPADRARRESEIADLPKLHPSIDELYDLEKLAVGAYSPLEGFMGSADLDSVLSADRLAGGLPWTMPILLAPSDPRDQATLDASRPGDALALLDPQDRFVGVLHLEEKYALDRSRIASTTYGTTDPAHPNVADLLAAGSTALGGKVDLVRELELPSRALELTPRQMREDFHRRGWASVAGYQCRNPPHTAHEYLQRLTLEREDVDAILVHPVVGRLKKGDYAPEVILAAYQELIGAYYPASRVALASLSITMRYGGPKAAFFLSLVRKNYGCSHYIVGRDQAGVGKYYDPYDCHRIFDRLDAGIVPLRYEETFFCRQCGWMATAKTCAHPPEARLATSQTRIREALTAGTPLPTEVIRPEVARVLHQGSGVVA